MKIALFASLMSPIPPNGYGAHEQMIWELKKEFDKKHDTHIFTLGKKLFPIDLFTEVYYGKKICKELRNFDVVNGFYGIPSFFPSREIENFVFTEGNPIPRNPLPLGTRAYRMRYKLSLAIERRVLENSGAITSASRAVKQNILDFANIPENKVNVIYYAVDTEIYKPLDVQRKNAVLYAGRVTPDKGLDILIEAFKIIQREHPNIELLLAGPQPWGEYMKKLVHQAKELNCSFLGNLESNELIKLYNQTLFTVLPSRSEAFGRTVIEANACGKPVVTSDLPCFKEIVTKNGLISQLDPTDLAEKILLLIEDGKLREQIGKNARRIVEEKFSWKVIARQYLELYEEVVG